MTIRSAVQLLYKVMQQFILPCI